MKPINYIFSSTALLCVLINISYAQPAIKWQKCFGGSSGEGAWSIQQTSDSGYIIMGKTWSLDGDVSGIHWDTASGAIWSDIWIVKINSSLTIQWQKCIGGTAQDEAYEIQQTSDGGYIVGGNTESNDGDISGNHGGIVDGLVVKLSSSGNIQWIKCLGGSHEDQINSVEQTNDGGFIAAGYTNSDDGDVSGHHCCDVDYWVVKLDSLGSIQWQKCLGGSGYDMAKSIKQTSDGGYIVAGLSTSNNYDVTGNHGNRDYWVVKLSSTGLIQWSKCYGGSDWEEANQIQQTSDGGYIIAGFTHSNDGDITGFHGTSGYDYWIVKITNTGSLQWQKCMGGSDVDRAYSIIQVNDGGYVAVGGSASNDFDVTDYHGMTDGWTVKLNGAGQMIWQKCLGGSHGDACLSISKTNDGEYIIAGGSASNDGDVSGNHDTIGNSADVWIVKLNPLPVISQPANNNLCESGDATFIITSSSTNLFYQWQESADSGSTWNNLSNGGIYSGTDSTILLLNNVPSSFNGYQYHCIISDTLGDTLTSNAATLIVNPIVPVIALVGSDFISSLATTYQWYLNGGIISGATLQNYTPLQNGLYTVEITDSTGCSAISVAYNLLNVGIPGYENEKEITILPNPASEVLSIEYKVQSTKTAVNCKVYDILGTLIIEKYFTEIKFQMDVSKLAKGLYLLRVEGEEENMEMRFVKE